MVVCEWCPPSTITISVEIPKNKGILGHLTKTREKGCYIIRVRYEANIYESVISYTDMMLLTHALRNRPFVNEISNFHTWTFNVGKADNLVSFFPEVNDGLTNRTKVNQ